MNHAVTPGITSLAFLTPGNFAGDDPYPGLEDTALTGIVQPIDDHGPARRCFPIEQGAAVHPLRKPGTLDARCG
jgi:hypothetical protein